MSARSRGSVPFCRRCCYCDSGTAAVEGTGRVMPGWKRCTGNEEVGGGVSSFPTLSSSSPGAIKMRFPNFERGTQPCPAGVGRDKKKFCVPPPRHQARGMVGDGENGLWVHAASFRAWESKAPPARGAAFLEKKKKNRMQCGGGLLTARCPPGCSEPGWRGVRRARPWGSFPCLFFSSSFSFFISLHYTASRPLPGCQQLAGSR